jgi:hypothetical protein
MKLLKEKYKTYDGAIKRCGFENSIARFEYERGYKARHYHYTVIQEAKKTLADCCKDDIWRVARHERPPL